VLLLIGAAENPADVVGYTDHVPAVGPDGQTPFTNPVVDQDTTIRISPQSGDFRLPRGAGTWSHVTWSKYVVVGNYSETHNGISQQVEDQRVGVYDTELRRFCELDLNPNLEPDGTMQNASVQWLRVASADQPQTRIYFSGYVQKGGYSLGYIEVDAANPSPCDPVSGWDVVGYTRDNLICRAKVLKDPPDPEDPYEHPFPLNCTQAQRDEVAEEDNPCPKNCGFDDMVLLDPQTISVGNWQNHRLFIAKVSGAGVLTIPDVYKTPPWQPVAEGACYDLRPVSGSVADPTRGSGDLRWTTSMDVSCNATHIISQPGCAMEKFCPFDAPGLACDNGDDTCSNASCEGQLEDGGFVDAAFLQYLGYTCQGVGLGAPTFACRDLPATNRCASGTRVGQACPSANVPLFMPQDYWCPGSLEGWGCECNRPRSKPTQEYSFDEETNEITATSALFSAYAPNENKQSMRLTYDSVGTLWMAAWPQVGGVTTVPLQAYYKGQDGEHAYSLSGSTQPDDAVVVPPDNQSLNYLASIQPKPAAAEVPGAMYIATSAMLQRLRSAFGLWFDDDAFTVEYGQALLPSEARVCEGTLNGCVSDTECAPASCVVWVPPASLYPNPQQTLWNFKDTLTAGGSPPSLWVTHGYKWGTNYPKRADNNLYLLRVPLSSPVPDSVVASRPAIAWNGGDCSTHAQKCRLWAAAWKDGAVRFRVRDDGFWSGWHALPAATLSTLVGPGIIAATWGGVEIFAQGTDGRLKHTYLTSADTCDPASCTWTAWTNVGSNLPANLGIAVASHLEKKLVVRRSSTNAILVMSGVGHIWSPWVELPGLTSSAAPSVTYHSADQRFWISARQSGSEKVHVTTYDPATGPQPWTEPGSPGSGAAPATTSWLAAPAIASDGDRVHVYAGAQHTNGTLTLFHKIENGSGWGEWRAFRTGANSGYQPAATNVYGDDLTCGGGTCEVHGEVLLVTGWPNSGLAELGSD
jgi:hypothetical protein